MYSILPLLSHENIVNFVKHLFSFSQYKNPANFVKHKSLLFIGFDNFSFVLDSFDDIFLLHKLFEFFKKLSHFGLQKIFRYCDFIKDYLRNLWGWVKDIGKGFRRFGPLQTFLDVIGNVKKL